MLENDIKLVEEFFNAVICYKLDINKAWLRIKDYIEESQNNTEQLQDSISLLRCAFEETKKHLNLFHINCANEKIESVIAKLESIL